MGLLESFFVPQWPGPVMARYGVTLAEAQLLAGLANLFATTVMLMHGPTVLMNHHLGLLFAATAGSGQIPRTTTRCAVSEIRSLSAYVFRMIVHDTVIVVIPVTFVWICYARLCRIHCSRRRCVGRPVIHTIIRSMANTSTSKPR